MRFASKLRQSFFVFAALTSLLLQACTGGGGGGGGANNTTPPQSTQSKEDIQNEFATRGFRILEVGGAATEIHALDLTRDSLRQLLQQHPLPTGTTTVVCATNGAQSFSINDVNNNGVLDGGDIVTVTLQNCTDSGVTSNGTVVVKISQFTSASQVDNLIADLTFTNFATVGTNGGNRLNGNVQATISRDFALAANTCHTSTTDAVFNNLVVNKLSASGVVNSTMTISSGHFTNRSGVDCAFALKASGIVASIDGLSGSLPIATSSEIFTDTDGIPYAGSYKLSGSLGQFLVTFNAAGNAIVQVDANNDGVYEETRFVKWSLFGGLSLP
ncbi:MAG TPA: hypothetical protein VN132_05625 [Bdellovibrio sp.]|nr:hypothetical protein [Bdellovibrio sp.]